MMKKLLSTVMISVLVLSNIFTASATSLNKCNLYDSDVYSVSSISTIEQNDVLNYSNVLPKSAYDKSYMQFENGYLSYSDSLTYDDATDMYFFSVPSDKFMTFKITSNNDDYVAEVAIVDWTSGVFYPTGVMVSSNQGIKAVDGISENQSWALYVHSNGTVGDTYQITANVKSPSNVAEVKYITSDLSKQVVELKTGILYLNDMNLTNSINNVQNTEVEFSMEDSWSVYPSGREYYVHDISDGKIKNIYLGEYYTNEISVKNALWIKLDKGTLWTYTHSIVNNSSSLSFYDITGQKTPRRFNDLDVNGEWGDHYLIYDLDKQQYVDFFSIYNIFFSSGAQKITDNTKILTDIKNIF